MAKGQSQTAVVLKKYEEDLLSDWMKQLKAIGSAKDTRISERELHAQMQEFLSLLQKAVQAGDISDTTGGGERLSTAKRFRRVRYRASLRRRRATTWRPSRRCSDARLRRFLKKFCLK